MANAAIPPEAKTLLWLGFSQLHAINQYRQGIYGAQGDTVKWIGSITLPLGFSFYTFLSISYTIDVYRKEFEPQRDFLIYLTYVFFWPHMIAGPILRVRELIPQLKTLRPPRGNELAVGIRQIINGLFLKVCLADQIAPFVDDAFLLPPSQLGGIDVWVMAFGFGFQIYIDFAGYSMIAGSASLLSVTFPNNFNWPYLATSPREFWRRWHITLSSWIRDYLYLPLSGLQQRGHSGGCIDIQFASSRRRWLRPTVALFLTWFTMGLWHGASWTFALWGVWHATFIYLYRQINRYLPSNNGPLLDILGWGTTLSIAMLGWIFSAREVSDPLLISMLGS